VTHRRPDLKSAPRIGAALSLRGTATQLIQELDTPEKCAQFYVEAQEPYGAVGEVMKHVRSLLMLGAKEGPIAVGDKFVMAEPSDYDYDLAVVKEIAPDCVKMVEAPTSDKMRRINEVAQGIYMLGISDQPIPPAAIEEILKLSQPLTYEAVDGNKLRAVLGRGDERAQKLIARRVKTPCAWKLVIKEGANASR